MSHPNEQPDGYVPFPETKPVELRVMGEKDVKDLQSKHDTQMDRLIIILVGVVLVLFVGFITLLFSLGAILLDSWRFHSDAYKNYIETVRTQGMVIEQYNRDRDEIKKQFDDLKNLIDKAQKLHK